MTAQSEGNLAQTEGFPVPAFFGILEPDNPQLLSQPTFRGILFRPCIHKLSLFGIPLYPNFTLYAHMTFFKLMPKWQALNNLHATHCIEMPNHGAGLFPC